MSNSKKYTLKKKKFNSLLFHPYISKYMSSWLHQDYDNKFEKNDLVKCEELQTSISNLQFRVYHFNLTTGILTLRFIFLSQKIKDNNNQVLVFKPTYQSKNNLTQTISLPITVKKFKGINYGFIQIPIFKWEEINPFYHFDIVDRPTIDQQYSLLQIKEIDNFKSTGVIFINNQEQTYKHLINQLYHQITIFSQKKPFVYHPGSNNQIIDIVHPSLYPLFTKTINSST